MTATLVGVAVTEGVFGGVLLSHPVPRAVPSAQAGLASGFGMGPGVSPPLWPPKLCRTVNTAITFPALSGGGWWCWWFGNRTVDASRALISVYDPTRGGVWQVIGLLVPVSSTSLSSSRPHPAYQPSRLAGSLSGQAPWRPHLEAGFPLRCLQRLSLPNVANQRCPWQDNWHTRGSSVPVLSY